MSLKTLVLLKPLIIDFIAFSPRKVLWVLVLMVLSGMTSGMSILLIVPLLSAIGVGFDGQGVSAANGLVQYILDLAGWFGLPLTLGYVLSLYLAIVLLSALISYFHTLISADLQRGFVVERRNHIFRKLLYTKWQFISGQRMTDFARLITHQVQQSGMSVNQLLSLAGQLIMIVIYLILSLLLSPALTGLALVCALLLAATLLPLNRRIHQSGRTHLTASRQIFNDVIEQLNNLKIIKSYAAESQYLEKMRSTNEQLETQQLAMTRYNALTRMVNLMGGAIIFTLLFYFAIQFIQLPVANLLVMLFIFSRLMPKVSSIQNSVQNLIHMAPSYIDLLQQVKELESHTELSGQGSHCPEFNAEIELSKVSYQYPNKQKDVFTELSVSLKKNHSYAIVGPSGAGKSTLADLVSGLIAPSSGQIHIDQQPLDNSNRQLWRKKVAYVTQDVFLFHDSVRENLAWVQSGPVSDQEIWAALRLAAAEDFIRALPMGLDTLIGDRGVKLSGGERQRLTLARALLCKPEILILDEATSALDRDNELKIRDALINLQGILTIIIIAHNETTIEHVQNRISLGATLS